MKNRDPLFCSTEGCGRPTAGRGLCIACYCRHRQRGTLPTSWVRQDHRIGTSETVGPTKYRRLEETIAQLGARVEELRDDLEAALEDARNERVRAEAAEEELRQVLQEVGCG